MPCQLKESALLGECARCARIKMKLYIRVGSCAFDSTGQNIANPQMYRLVYGFNTRHVLLVQMQMFEGLGSRLVLRPGPRLSPLMSRMIQELRHGIQHTAYIQAPVHQ